MDLADFSKKFVYVNGVEVSPTWSTYTNDYIGLTPLSSWTIGANWNANNPYEGSFSNFYFDTSYTDLSANNPFWNADENKPAFLGVNGELPTGSAPLIYLPMRADNAGVNKGTGGDFSVTGTLEGARGPSEFWANSADFAGTTGWLNRGTLSGVENTQFLTFATTFKPDNTTNTITLYNGDDDLSPEHDVLVYLSA